MDHKIRSVGRFMANFGFRYIRDRLDLVNGGRLGPMTEEKVKLKTIDQVCVVVRDIQKAVEQYWQILGIGPWSIYTVKPPELKDTTVRGNPTVFSMKLAFAKVGSMMLELIQPLEGESLYKEFLAEKGEGIHHVASYEVDDLERAISLLENRGIGVLQSGRWKGASFAYMDTEKSLGAIVELVKRTTEFPPPEATYPQCEETS